MKKEPMYDGSLLKALVDVAYCAGEQVMAVYRAMDNADVQCKQDASPVTKADRDAEAIILKHLYALTPKIPVVAEEEVSAGRIPSIDKVFWLVDPLDGTKEFISGNGEFTVNIALIEDGQAVLGVVYAPALGRMFYGMKSYGAFVKENDKVKKISCRIPPSDGLTVVASRSHGDERELDRFLSGKRIAHIVNAGSSLKLCLIAVGEADLYPRLGRTMEWDIAAGHAILAAAGGTVALLDGSPLTYGKTDFANPYFLAKGMEG